MPKRPELQPYLSPDPVTRNQTPVAAPGRPFPGFLVNPRRSSKPGRLGTNPGIGLQAAGSWFALLGNATHRDQPTLAAVSASR